jgi:hypothetical protein
MWILTQYLLTSAEQIFPGNSAFEFEMAIKISKDMFSMNSPQKLLKQEGRKFHSDFYSHWNKKKLLGEWKKSIIVSINKNGN